MSALVGGMFVAVSVVVVNPTVGAAVPSDDVPEWLEGFDPADWDEGAAPEPVPWEGSTLVEPSLAEASDFEEI